MRSLYKTHPAVVLVYFLALLVLLMFVFHPIFSLLAFFGGLLFSFQLQRQGCRKELPFLLLLILVVGITNPLFSHRGETPLFFLSGNPVTLEALLYGLHLGVTMAATILWFRCFGLVLGEEKILFLFGGFSPKLALLISSALGFVPRLQRRGEELFATHQTLGLFSETSWVGRVKGSLKVYSALISWALEQAMETGNAMKARGYGLPGRTHYGIYRFYLSDFFTLLVALFLLLPIFVALVFGQPSFSFYPGLQMGENDIFAICSLIGFGMLSLLPFILETKEGILWRFYRSKI